VVDQVEASALETLFVPFRTGMLPWPERVAFLRARYGAALTQMPAADLICEQSFKPEADALERGGYRTTSSIGPSGETFPLVLVLPPRQRDESKALLARAVRLAGPGGRVVAAGSNTTGARSIESDLEQLAPGGSSQSKNKCRACWTPPLGPASINTKLVDEWLKLDLPRPICAEEYVSRPGLFAWDRIDPASELLMSELPASLSGRAADLGAGFGYLSRELLKKCPGIKRLDVYEAEARALDLARHNVHSDTEPVAIEFFWHDVTAGLDKSYDVIVTNPPFHTGSGADDPGLGRRFITAAARALNPGGRLFVVANRHLPYEGILNSSFGFVRIATQQYGFKIIEATRAKAGPPFSQGQR
jgi:16S rRNA (guanine1207-N2)-methyltransferase